jgi:hypothetical protein
MNRITAGQVWHSKFDPDDTILVMGTDTSRCDSHVVMVTKTELLHTMTANTITMDYVSDERDKAPTVKGQG